MAGCTIVSSTPKRPVGSSICVSARPTTWLPRLWAVTATGPSGSAAAMAVNSGARESPVAMAESSAAPKLPQLPGSVPTPSPSAQSTTSTVAPRHRLLVVEVGGGLPRPGGAGEDVVHPWTTMWSGPPVPAMPSSSTSSCHSSSPIPSGRSSTSSRTTRVQPSLPSRTTSNRCDHSPAATASARPGGPAVSSWDLGREQDRGAPAGGRADPLGRRGSAGGDAADPQVEVRHLVDGGVDGGHRRASTGRRRPRAGVPEPPPGPAGRRGRR